MFHKEKRFRNKIIIILALIDLRSFRLMSVRGSREVHKH